MTVELYQFPTDRLPDSFDLPNISPFCTKMETWLRLAGIDYVVKPWTPMMAPNGKAPVVVIDGETVPDSGIIVRELTRRMTPELDAHLTPEQHATGRLVTRTLEEHTYWVEVYGRWATPAGWAAYKPLLSATVPLPGVLLPPMLWWMRRGVLRSLHEHGLGRHPADEVWARGIEDLTAIGTLLGTNDFLLGDRPSTYDAMLWSMLAHAMHPIWDDPYRRFIRGHDAFPAYVERLRARVWSEPS